MGVRIPPCRHEAKCYSGCVGRMLMARKARVFRMKTTGTDAKQGTRMLRRDGDSSGIEKEGKQTSLRAGCRHGRKRGGQPPFFIFLRRPSGTSLDDAKTSSMPWVSRRGDRWFAKFALSPALPHPPAYTRTHAPHPQRASWCADPSRCHHDHIKFIAFTESGPGRKRKTMTRARRPTQPKRRLRRLG